MLLFFAMNKKLPSASIDLEESTELPLVRQTHSIRTVNGLCAPFVIDAVGEMPYIERVGDSE